VPPAPYANGFNYNNSTVGSIITTFGTYSPGQVALSVANAYGLYTGGTAKAGSYNFNSGIRKDLLQLLAWAGRNLGRQCQCGLSVLYRRVRFSQQHQRQLLRLTTSVLTRLGRSQSLWPVQMVSMVVSCSASLRVAAQVQNQRHLLLLWELGLNNKDGRFISAFRVPPIVGIKKGDRIATENGVEVKFGNGQPRRINFMWCGPKQCVAEGLIDDAFVKVGFRQRERNRHGLYVGRDGKPDRSTDQGH